MSQPTPAQTADLIDRAADLLAAGWTQGDLRLGDCYCLDGALLAAAGHEIPDRAPSEVHYALLKEDPALTNATQCLSAQIIKRGFDVFDAPYAACYRYNDSIGRTQGEVVSLCRETAADLRT